MKDFFTEADCDVDVCSDWSNQRYKGISPITANRLLRERGRVVTGIDAGIGASIGASWSIHLHRKDTHTALLINIEPIEQDTAESLLKEFIRKWDDPLNQNWPPIIERAKKLLEKK